MVLIRPSGSAAAALRCWRASRRSTTGDRDQRLVVNGVAPRAGTSRSCSRTTHCLPDDGPRRHRVRPAAPAVAARRNRPAVTNVQELRLGELLDPPARPAQRPAATVALGRALVREPSVLLMNEPLSNLDAALRVQARGEIRRLQREVGRRRCTSRTTRWKRSRSATGSRS